MVFTYVSQEGNRILWMTKIMTVDIKIMKIIKVNNLPERYKNIKPTELGAFRIVEESIYELIEDMRRRNWFNKEFNINSNERMTSNNEIEQND